MEVCIPYALNEEEEICIGEILVTEVEALVPSHTETDEEFDKMTLSGGYGLIFGRNENKAIALSLIHIYESFLLNFRWFFPYKSSRLWIL